ncbi:flagellar hook capping FlgD N-terminal domain-containing protein [uncultured Buchnera sp.]|uniref:flagellar hook capping FlgD N-terminal domain-containing protein n=1 Tax=uncultured Buchnera sp. TaxID=574037 RepID=UPI0025FAB80C|nr:flagellar hook capping FlgD N-terminal domain-containing protein [uncultured Buchnera sp.]
MSIAIDAHSSNIDLPIDNRFAKNKGHDLQNNINPLDLQKNFLSLLVAQIKNQDPTDPIKNSDLTSQLAQINTASGVERLNNTVIKFSNEIAANQNIQLSSLIGRHVTVPSKKIMHTKDSETKFGIELMGNATSIKIQITDEKNKILYLKTISKDIKAGRYTFVWNGKDLNKRSLTTGTYNISVKAQNKEQNVPVQSLSEALVNSIIISSEEPIIDLGKLGKTIASDIREILK